MNFNYSYEKNKFDKEWKRIETEYRNAGMSESDINIMKEFDWNFFKLRRTETLHTYQLNIGNISNDKPEDEMNSTLFYKFPDKFLQTDIQNHSRYWWLEELDSDELLKRVKCLSRDDIELLTLYVFDEKTQNEIAKILKISQKAVSKRLAKIKKFLKR